MSSGRIAIQLDSIEADAFDQDGDKRPSEKGLGFLRIVSTQAVLQGLLSSNESLEVGDWLEAEINPNLSLPGPWVWSLQLQNDRFVGGGSGGRPQRGKLIRLQRLASASQPVDPRPLSAGVPAARTKGAALKARYSLRNVAAPISPAAANAYLRRWSRVWGTSQAIALDVGQASFNIVVAENTSGPALYFDVGQPIWFHLHNAPAGFAPPVLGDGLVILSHWDTDHYAYGRQNTDFHSKHWFAPAQVSVGPNANAFAQKLQDLGKLTLVGAGRSSRHRRGARIIRCGGSSSNGSGLALHLRTFGRNILFTGDADYHEIPSMRGVRLSGLQLPHHGGKLTGTAAIPTGHGVGARAVVSCGLPNRYGHPNQLTISEHHVAKWNVQVTADWLGVPRGKRFL